jgi:nucleotide-binding universal stress UspA family protein
MWSPAVKEAQEKTRALTHRYLESVSIRIQEGVVPTQAVTVEGRPHLEITRFSEENQIDLIVMCTHGQSGLGRWLMGGVADRVSRASRLPVLLVPVRKDSAKMKPEGQR